MTTAPVAPVASMVRFGLTDVIVGGVVSCTLTVNVFVVALPCASVAVTVTVVMPNPKIVPDACE